MSNLVQNPGFEVGLDGWDTTNVVVANENPFEGHSISQNGTGCGQRISRYTYYTSVR